MEKISPPSNSNGTLNTNQSSLSAQLPLNAFAELKSSLLPLPESGRTLLPSGSDRFQSRSIAEGHQSVHDLPSSSIEQIDPSANARRETLPGPAASLTTGIDANPYRGELWRTSDYGTSPLREPPRAPSFVYRRGTLYPSLRYRHDHARPAVDSSSEHNIGHEEMLPISLQWIARDELALLEESIQNNATQHTPTPAQTQTVPNGYVNPGSPRNESNPYHQRTGPQHDQSCATSDPRDHLPGWYPLGDPRTLNSAAKSTAYFTPGVPKPTRRNQTGYGSTSSHQPPYVNQQPYYQNPPSQRPLSPTAWPQPRSRPEKTRRDDENGTHGRIFHQSGESSWPYEQSPKVHSTTKKPPLSTISESPPITSPLDDYQLPSQPSASDPSSREEFFNNINSQFIPNTTFLLEDKMCDLFSVFLSDLSKSLHTVPNKLVESCVSKFETIVHKNLNEMLSTEIVPSLISEVLHHVETNNMNKENIISIQDELIPLKDFMKENIECVQDIIHVNDSQMQAHIEQVRHDIKELNQKQEQHTSYWAGLINELNKNENTRFEQIKRRLEDMTQNVNILNNKLNSDPANEHHKAPPPHLHYNNPFLNQAHIPPPASQEIPAHFQPVRNVCPAASPKHEPEWKILFPFTKHNIDNDIRKELWKSIPKTHEWEKFSGELPYNHELWLQNVDVFVEDYYLLDHMIISRLTSILTDTAKNWYLGLRNNHGDKSWAWWKNAIKNKFGTDHWRWKVQEEFEADRFSLENKKIHKWFNTQRERLKAYQPELSEFLVCEKVLKQCPGTLDHAIKSRYKREPSEINFEDMDLLLTTFPITIDTFPTLKTLLGKMMSPGQDDLKKTPSNQAGTKPTKCFFCFQTGHLSKDCPKKKNRVNNVEAQGGEDDPDPNDNADDYDYDQPLNSDENNEDNQQNSALVLAMHQHNMDHPMMSLGNHAIECELPQELSIAEIQAACHQPQTWSTDCQTSHIEDARLMKCKPDKGKAHLLGSQNLTNVLTDGNQYTCLLDSGASCSIISQQLLQSIKPLWKDNLMPIHQARFHSCSDQLIPLGVVELPLIFPHTKGSVRVQTEFVVMKNGRMNYIILGNDYLSLYGFDINNSKDRSFTIGNENKKKKFSFKSHHAELMTPSSEISAVDKQQSLMNEFINTELSEANINDSLTTEQKKSLFHVLFVNQSAFANTDNPLGAIKGHEVNIKLTTERPYPPLLRRTPYPASPKSREALEEHIEELVRLNVLRKVGHNEVVEITTPVIIAWHNGKSRMVGDFRALNTYTAADRYPNPKITETLNNLAKAKFLTSMDVLKGFHQNVIATDSRQFLRIILHKGIYEYLRMCETLPYSRFHRSCHTPK
ncbi:hypothetical protein PSHT_01452 [Puccinia striiformis]|uniref:CCHC-type domain-containing protein n=1 Tax=Puccinia striiformis TaxID=27350 RepID=A0A2S4WKJ2_9BASI|nr:hypothetical protein PSHT_01452 [Puccinia striiformis]